MKITDNGVHKLDTNSPSASVSVFKISGDLGGATAFFGYADGENIIKYDDSTQAAPGRQYRIEHGSGESTYLLITGGFGVNLNVLVRGIK